MALLPDKEKLLRMCRASLAMYNTHEEVDRLVTGLQRIHRLLG